MVGRERHPFVLREPAVRPNAEDSHVQVTPYCEGPGVDASSGLGANFRPRISDRVPEWSTELVEMG